MRACDTMLPLVNDLLDTSAVETGRLVLEARAGEYHLVRGAQGVGHQGLMVVNMICVCGGRLPAAALIVVLGLEAGAAKSLEAGRPEVAVDLKPSPIAENTERPSEGKWTRRIVGQQLSPRDDGSRDSSFAVFRAKVMSVVRRRDWARLKRFVDPRVEVEYDGPVGIEAFEAMWKPHDPKGPLWKELDIILGLGGELRDHGEYREFVAPYVLPEWPGSVEDDTGLAVVIGHDVPVFSDGGTRERVVARLSYHVVRADLGPLVARTAVGDRENLFATLPSEYHRWIAIYLPDGATGFVQRRWLRSPYDYFAVFEERNGQWRLAMFATPCGC